MTTISKSINSSSERTSKSKPKSATKWISGEGEPGMVSIIVPTFERVELLQECVESLLEQTYRPIEIIVVENSSEDTARESMTRLADSAAEGIEVTYLHRPGGGGRRVTPTKR